MYFCEFCNYKSTDKSNYNRHLKSKKHLRNSHPGSSKSHPKVIQGHPKVIQKSSRGHPEMPNPLQCPHCLYIFKYKQGLSKHKLKNRCKSSVKSVIQNITNNNNITNNTNNTTNNNLNMILKIGSIEEAEKIKSLITPEVILKLCEPKRAGLPRQTYDMIKSISNYSIQLKQENKELQNFKKTNIRDNMIDIYDKNWNKEYFSKYILKDIQKYAEIILKKCEEKAVQPDISRDEKLEIIREVCQNYDKYKKIDEEDLDGIISFTLDAIDDQIKEHKILHYNITNTRASNEDNKDI